MTARAEHWQFRPHPLFRGGHVQTIVGIYMPRRHNPYAAVRHFVPADEMPPEHGGDQIVLHEDRPASWRHGDPIVLLIHGLAGSYESSYMRRMTDRLTERGYSVFRMDMRGCGAGRGYAKQPTHCGRSDDVATVVEYLAGVHPAAPTYIVGFSLGGSQALKMLAEQGDAVVGNLAGTLAICPPIDLFDVERRFATPGGRPYDKFFTRLLWRQALDRWQRYPDLAPGSIPRRPKRLGILDEMLIAPAAGFPSARDYYHGTQVGPRLSDISQHATILAAEDDPIVPTGPLRKFKHGPGVEAIYIPQGGHLGFIGGRGEDPDRRWLDWRIIDWIQHRQSAREVRAVGPGTHRRSGLVGSNLR